MAKVEMADHLKALEAVKFEQLPDLELAEGFRNAMDKGGYKFNTAHAYRGRDGLGFRVTLELPQWAKDLRDQMIAEGENRGVEGGRATTPPVGRASASNLTKEDRLRASFESLLDDLFG